jgi:hypothetical protein
VDSLLCLLVCFELVSAGKYPCFPLPDLCLPGPSRPCLRSFTSPFGGIKLFGSDLDFDKRVAVARRVPRFFYVEELLFSGAVFCSDKCSSS